MEVAMAGLEYSLLSLPTVELNPGVVISFCISFPILKS